MKYSKKPNAASRDTFIAKPTWIAEQPWRQRIFSVLVGLLLSMFWVPAFADSYTSTIHITWGSPTPLLALNPGDKVRIQTQLSSSDTTVPETVEDEPLIVSLSSPGSFSSASVITDQYLTDQIDSVPADPNGPPVLSAYITGYDGDESADVIVSVNPVEAVKKTAEEIENWEKLAQSYEKGHINADIAEHMCPPVVFCKKAEAALAAFYGSQAIYYERLAQDPPDSNYTVIALPQTPSITPLAYDPSVPNNVIDAFNALFENYKQSIGLEQALLTTFNRATGAMVVQDATWQQKQTQAATMYLLQLSDLANRQPDLQTTLQNAWNAAGLPSLVASASDIHAYQIQIFYNGLPVNEVQILTQAGLTSQDIEYLRRVTVAQNYSQVASLGGFPASLTDPVLNNALHKAAASLSGLAISNATPLAAGQKLHGEGKVTLPDNSSLQFEFNAQIDPDPAAGSALKGHLEMHKLGNMVDIEDGKVTAAWLIGNLMIVNGTYTTENHETGTYRIIAVDNSTKGSGNDTFDITLSNGFHATGVLSNGNIKIVNLAGRT